MPCLLYYVGDLWLYAQLVLEIGPFYVGSLLSDQDSCVLDNACDSSLEFGLGGQIHCSVDSQQLLPRFHFFLPTPALLLLALALVLQVLSVLFEFIVLLESLFEELTHTVKDVTFLYELVFGLFGPSDNFENQIFLREEQLFPLR